MKIKTVVFLIILSLILALLSSCIKIETGGNKPKEEYRREGVKMSKEEAEKFDKEIRENLNYYEDIYTAIENNRLGDNMGVDLELIEVLKTIENDEKIIIYGIIKYSQGYENFTVIPLLKKKEKNSDKFLYSEPLRNSEVNYESYESDTIDIERYRQVFFQRLNYLTNRNDTTLPEKENFQYFLLLNKEEAESIKVNGVKPDEIIEYEINDQELKRHKAYFVYFSDLPMDGTFDDMDITFD